MYAKHTYVITYSTGSVLPDHIQITFRTHTIAEHDSSTMYIDDVTINMAGTAGVQLMHNTVISCYPNPAGNVLHLQTADHQSATTDIYHMLGQRVASQWLTGYITDLNISKLSPGMYYIRVLGSNDEAIYSTKIVKQ